MQYIKIAKWDTFQHYKKRNPPWIKLYAWILDNDEFDCMHDASKLLYFCLLPFASRRQNKIKLDLIWLQKKLPIDNPITQDTIQPLVDNGFIVCYQDASNNIAECKQDATPETEERQRESRVEIEGDCEKFTLQQVEDVGFKAGIPDDECKVFYDYYNSQGWKKTNNMPITNLPSQLANWRNNGHKFEKPKAEPTKTDANIAQWEQRFGCYVRDTRPERVVNDLASNLENPEFKKWATSISQRLRGYYESRS
jgi:hypothetical protein